MTALDLARWRPWRALDDDAVLALLFVSVTGFALGFAWGRWTALPLDTDCPTSTTVVEHVIRRGRR